MRCADRGCPLPSRAQLNPVVGFWDPFNLSGGEFWGDSNAATIGFLRESEIKHGRVAMAGFVGYIVHANDIKFPWAPFTSAPSGVSPQALWDGLPEVAKWQIILTVGFFEFWRTPRAPTAARDHWHPRTRARAERLLSVACLFTAARRRELVHPLDGR